MSTKKKVEVKPDPTAMWLKQLIEYKKERIEEVENGSEKIWSKEVVEKLETDIYAIEAIIEDREFYEID